MGLAGDDLSLPRGSCSASGAHQPHEASRTDPLELRRVRVREAEGGTFDEVAHRLGEQHLAAPGAVSHARGDVHADPGELLAVMLDLAGVHPGADLKTHVPGGLGELLGPGS
jgi:hypothetical protein